ncbi:MAG: ATP-binding protein [Psychrosphaera sp.]|nr:ATP-binding protein [Psychrosphaera sp.]
MASDPISIDTRKKSSPLFKRLFWPLLAGFGCGVGGLYLVILTHANLIGLGLLILCGICFRQIFKAVSQTETDVLSFLQSIEYQDFSRRFQKSGNTGQTFELANAFDQVLSQFQQLKLEHQQQTHLLKSVIQQIGSGILLIDHKGHITIRNTAAVHQLNIAGLKTRLQISEKYPQLNDIFNDEDGTFSVDLNNRQFQLIVHRITVGSQSYQLIVLTNIHDEIESNEIESWQKLISVLIHEISNSITPISSLSSTVDDMVTLSIMPKIAELGINDDDLNETINDVHQSVATISRRSQGLIDFVDEYRKLTRVNIAEKKPVAVVGLIQQIQTLLSDELSQQQVEITVNIEPANLKLNIDQSLIEQVLINIFINALQATENQQTSAKITVNAYINDYAKAVIDISDNGMGMTEQGQSKIFTPFYTTKPTGSGIGLALARQIMHKHRGAIQVSSEIDKGSRFRLIF